MILRTKLSEAAWKDPAVLVADDVIALAATLDMMQAIADACCLWAEENGLNWNPTKYQLLRMLVHLRGAQQRTAPRVHERAAEMKLNNVEVKCNEEAEYLGLRIHT